MNEVRIMRKAALIEGIMMLGIASAGIIEAMYIISHRDMNTVDELIGPGSYILFLAVPLMITGLSHLFMEYRKKSSDIKLGSGRQIDVKLVGIFLMTALYIYLIGVIGYLLSSLIFFVIAFKLSGVKSWWNNIMISCVISGSYYIIFVRMCDLIFPKAIFFAGF
jgi:hypothetical protein